MFTLQVPPPEKKQRKETLLSAELGKYVDKKVRVKFQGGREGMDGWRQHYRISIDCWYYDYIATGILKGYDQLLNLVLDGTIEHVQGMTPLLLWHIIPIVWYRALFGTAAPDDPFKITDETRNLGLVVCRGTAVVLICPADSMETIANPFIQQEV